VNMPITWKKIEEESPYLLNHNTPQDNTPQQDTPEMSRMETFVPQSPSKCLEDVILPSTVKSRIEAALNRIRYHDKLYYDWNLKKIDPQGRRVAINFFGPPGTGKTFCAEAIAHHLQKQIISVNYAEIESKYVGETPKNITAAFKKAKETDSVLFFDEADSILGKRLTSVTQSADHGVNVSRSVMLLQLDSFDGVVIFASNLPENYDGAFVRRILAHVEFELPDEACRTRLWEYLLPAEVPREVDVNPEWLASQSDGLSGGDILNVVKLAASQAVARIDHDCKIFQKDILNAISQVQVGKQKVGLPATTVNRPVSVQETIIQPDELPADARQRYDLAISNINAVQVSGSVQS
jgi:SpoVK/Ycf46/Vps4 family AAA+-type ATPase